MNEKEIAEKERKPFQEPKMRAPRESLRRAHPTNN